MLARSFLGNRQASPLYESAPSPPNPADSPFAPRTALHRPITPSSRNGLDSRTVSEQSNIFLIGPMGSGKSAVGKQLARELRLEFVDSDAEIELRTGVDISYIFEKEGEAGFRAREREAIGDIAVRRSIVLATGGGAVLDADNRRELAENGTVVYLRATVAQQLERTRNTRHRPLLTDRDPETVLTELMAVRAPLYEEIADIVVDTGGRRVNAVVGEIRKKLKKPRAPALKK
jgi:shikimate kinase